MVDLKGFRKANHLTQEKLGEYLGMQDSFISKIEHGKEKLPPLKLQKLLDNNMGWDTSMLMVADTIHRVNDINIQYGVNNTSDNGSCEAELAALRKENEMLRSQVEDLKSREAQYWEMIKNLTAK